MVVAVMVMGKLNRTCGDVVMVVVNGNGNAGGDCGDDGGWW